MACDKCTVVYEELTTEDIIRMRGSQKNTSTPNCRDGEETAFSKALRGSRLYLITHGFIEDTGE